MANLVINDVDRKARESFRNKALKLGYSMTEALKIWIEHFLSNELDLPVKK